MYNLLIVDDEQYVREGLRCSYNWSRYGFQVMDTAENGRMALEIIKHKRPHVVLTDIVMPEMDGLEFTRHVRLLYPDVNVVLVSSYENFHYARRAISYGVKGYLLKPIEEEELTSVFNSLRHRLVSDGARGLDKQRDAHTVDTIAGAERFDDNEYILKAKQFVQDHYEDRITLEEVSKHLHITAGYFGSIFKRETGQNFIDYVISIKMDKAKNMLRYSDSKVKDISARLGYYDYTYFCKIFKKNEGCTPLEYRTMN